MMIVMLYSESEDKEKDDEKCVCGHLWPLLSCEVSRNLMKHIQSDSVEDHANSCAGKTLWRMIFKTRLVLRSPDNLDPSLRSYFPFLMPLCRCSRRARKHKNYNSPRNHCLRFRCLSPKAHPIWCVLRTEILADIHGVPGRKVPRRVLEPESTPQSAFWAL